MKIRILIIIATSLILGSCTSENVDEININFKLSYGDEPLVMFEEVEYPDGRNFEFTRFSFFISDVRLNDGTSSTLVKDVDYIDLTPSHATIADAEAGYDYVITLEDIESFDKLEMNFGLTDAQNATRPEDYTSSSALSLSGEYWANWESYVYVKIEGRMDLDNDGISDGIALHLGSEVARRAITVNDLDSASDITLSIDVRKIFDNNGVIYDIDSTPRIHSLDQLDQTQLLMDNFVNSLEFTL